MYEEGVNISYIYVNNSSIIWYNINAAQMDRNTETNNFRLTKVFPLHCCFYAKEC